MVGGTCPMIPARIGLSICLTISPPVRWGKLIRKITFRRLITGILLLAGLYLLLIVGFGYLRYLPYFGFFLLCLMGCAFLVITYLLKQ